MGSPSQTCTAAHSTEWTGPGSEWCTLGSTWLGSYTEHKPRVPGPSLSVLSCGIGKQGHLFYRPPFCLGHLVDSALTGVVEGGGSSYIGGRLVHFA